ncbi:MAG: Hsp20/alpha crystallin family protein [Anaerolineaceae bacterium]|nr:Hsp20/alpha crystallin family protein [Anaerolineaceae bacterium]
MRKEAYIYRQSPTPHMLVRHTMERMPWEPRPEGEPRREGHFQPGTQRHEHHTGHHRHGFRIPMDVESREDAFVISALLPGLKAEDVTIQVEGQTVSIEGEIKFEEDEKANWLLRERPRGCFSRRIELPTLLDAEKAKASFTDGILTLTIPMSPEARPKTIKVNVK